MQNTQVKAKANVEIISQSLVTKSQSSYYRSKAPTPIISLNPLIGCANQVLHYLYQIQLQQISETAHELYQNLVHEINAFVTLAKKRDYPNETIMLARYILCATLDDILLNVAANYKQAWKLHTLISTFYPQQESENQSFIFMNKLLQEPKKHTETLELFYLCLRTGYQGEYRQIDNHTLHYITDDLYKLIRQQKQLQKPVALALSKKTQLNEKSLTVSHTLKYTGLACLFVFSVYLCFNLIFNQIAKPLNHEINLIKSMKYEQTVKSINR